jgi:hypothetical protein
MLAGIQKEGYEVKFIQRRLQPEPFEMHEILCCIRQFNATARVLSESQIICREKGY